MSDWDSDEPVGYRKPPKWTRYPKGKSGNPKGRPKKQQELKQSTALIQLKESDAILDQEINRTVSLTEGGKVIQTTMHQAIRRSQAVKAAKGHVVAMRDILGDAARLEERKKELAQHTALADEEREQQGIARNEQVFAYFDDLKQGQEQAWAEALAAGRKEPDFPWPHPEDVMLDHVRTRWHVRGPWESDDVPLYYFMQAQRDFCFVQIALAYRCGGRTRREKAKFWACLCALNDAMLPKRWQVCHDPVPVLGLLLVMPIKQLRDMTRAYHDKSERVQALVPMQRHSKAAYQVANDVMKPVLDPMGYRSLAQFKKAYEETGGDPPWPLV
jgi:hypothetical protein